MKRIMATAAALVLTTAAWGQEGGVSVEKVGSPETRPITTPASPALGKGEVGSLAGLPYFGATLGYSIKVFSGDLDEVDWDSALSVGVKGGIFAADWLALEVAGLYSGPYVYEYSVWDSDYRHVLNAFSLTANAKLMVPAGDGFRPYLLVGGGYGWVRIDYDWPSYFDAPSSSTDDGGFGRVGIGFDYFSTAGIGLECEATYNCGFGDISDFRYVALQAGIVVLFGSN